MLRIQTFIIGGLLVLTGAAGYLFQDLALSLTIKGPLADDAIFVLSDGKERHEMDFIPTTGSAGENVWWIVHKLNEEHARDASQGNYVAEQTGRPEEAKSFWYASSRGATLKGMLQESENYNNAGSGEPIAINWSSIDANSSNLRIVYKKVGDNDGNVTLTSNNWTNAEFKNREVKPDEVLTFKKSWTAFIPGIIGLLLIALAQAGEKLPNARKHIMHLAVALGFVCLLVVGKMIGGAVGEMFWLKDEPYGIIHASMLKSVSMLLSTGLLAIFVVLCVLSFIEARKEKAAQEKLDAVKDKNKASAEVKKKAGEEKEEPSKEKKVENSEEEPKGNDQRTDEENKDDEDSQEAKAKLDEPATVQNSAEEDGSKSDAQTTEHEAGEEKEEPAKEKKVENSEEEPKGNDQQADEENKDDEDSQEEVQAKLDEPATVQDSAEEDDSKSDAQTTKHEEPLEKKSEENIRSSEEQPERVEKEPKERSGDSEENDPQKEAKDSKNDPEENLASESSEEDESSKDSPS
tara:strand:+ start:2200 stop:3756 length:1557 start_codon:yes stop_codon:yes gene_type:complete